MPSSPLRNVVVLWFVFERRSAPIRNLILPAAFLAGAALLSVAPSCGDGPTRPDAGARDALPIDAGNASLADAADVGDVGDVGDASGVGGDSGQGDGGCSLDDSTYWRGTFTFALVARFPSSGAAGTCQNSFNESSTLTATLRNQSGLRQRAWAQETDQDVVGAGSFDNEFVATIDDGYVTDDLHLQGSAQGIQMPSAYPPCPGLPAQVLVDLDACTYSVQFPCVQITGTSHRVVTPGLAVDGTYTHEVGAYRSGILPLPPGRCPHLSATQTAEVSPPVPLDAMGTQPVDAVVTWDLAYPDCQ